MTARWVRWLLSALRSSYMKILAPPPPRVARSNRKRQKECRLEEKKKTVEAQIISVDWPLRIGSAAGLENPSPGPDLPPLTRFCRSSTWQIDDHVLLIKLKVSFTCRTEENSRGKLSVWTAADMKLIHGIHVCDTLAADIYVMWHRCESGSLWRWSVSSALLLLLFFLRHVSAHVGEEEEKSQCGLLLLHFSYFFSFLFLFFLKPV